MAAVERTTPGRSAFGARGACEAEHGQPGDQHALAAHPVAEAPRGEEQGGEDQAVRVHDPLQLACRRVQLPYERRKRDVDDRRVEVDDERGEEERREDEWL